MDKKTIRLLLFVLAVFAVGLVVLSMFWHGDSIYEGAYAPIVEKSLQRKQEAQKENGDSDQPQAPGFREKDIDRQKGDGFATY